MEQKLYMSDRAKNYPASGIRKMFDLAAQYPEAIKLTVGEPNFDTPQYIKEAARLQQSAAQYQQKAITLQKEALLKNLDYG